MPPEPNPVQPTENSAVPSEPVFQYGPLPNGQDYIRLINVRNWDEGNLLQCEVVEVAIWDAPPYEAISYTWGDPLQLSWVLVNGKRLRVRRNCEYVLRQSRWCGTERYIWVDAICINQSDVVERSAQVQLMGDIYKTAVRVLACIGPHADDSEYLMAFLRQKRGREVEGGYYAYGDSTIFRSMHQIGDPRLYQASQCMWARPYFRRIWALQEVFLAREVQICCGQDCMLSALFSRYDQIIKLNSRRNRPREEPAPYGDSDPGANLELALPALHRSKWDEILENWNAYHTLTGFANQCPPELLTLSRLLKETRRHACQDQRDRLYGLLNMVDWEQTGANSIPPDYTKSPADFLEALWAALVDRRGGYHIQDPWPRREVLGWFSPFDIRRSLAAEIESRSLANNPTSEPLDTPKAYSPGEKSQYWHEAYGGLQLFLVDKKWTVRIPHNVHLDDYLHLRKFKDDSCLRSMTRLEEAQGKRQNDQNLVLEKDEDETPAILLPKNIRPGDWLLFPRPDNLLPKKRCIMVVRQTDDDSFDLIGQAAHLDTRAHHHDSLGLYELAIFKISFDLRDLLVIETQEKVIDSILDLCDGASPKVRSEPELEREVAQAHTEIVDTRPCRTEGSSKVQLVKIKHPPVDLNIFRK